MYVLRSTWIVHTQHQRSLEIEPCDWRGRSVSKKVLEERRSGTSLIAYATRVKAKRRYSSAADSPRSDRWRRTHRRPNTS